MIFEHTASWLITIDSFKQKKPDDFVVATGQTQSVRQFINIAAKLLNMKIVWKGQGLNEKA